MKYTVSQDAMGTHIDWEHEGVTAHMIDWFWSNMEKGFILWHPEQHEPLEWAVPPQHGNPIGSIHIAPQTWDDGRRQNLYIRFEKLEDVPAEVRDYLVYEHVVIVAGLGLGEECLVNPDPMGYRIHQWQKTDSGVVGKSSGIGTRRKETPEDGRIWAAHCAQEIGNWGHFLPQLHTLYKVVTDTRRNPFADLSVDGKGRDAVYRHIK
ncbi:hypothetical protein [Castellaniella sp.]|uniref:hypothetical protein n=1 Tax=Castellaniella sp. TaxID=1955812 RepID=UPI002AFFD44D|nr:hypothetical protein [Castellaniella sp.]